MPGCDCGYSVSGFARRRDVLRAQDDKGLEAWARVKQRRLCYHAGRAICGHFRQNYRFSPTVWMTNRAHVYLAHRNP